MSLLPGDRRMHSADSVQDNNDIALCGELRAYRVTHYELSTSAIFAQIGASTPWIFRPFTDEDVTAIVALSERYLLVRGERHALAVADVVEQTIIYDTSIAAAGPGSNPVRQGSMMPSADGSCFLWASTPWRLISSATLSVICTFDGTRAADGIVRRKDGSFVVVGIVPCLGTSKTVQRIVIVHPEGRIIIQDPLDERGIPVPEVDLKGFVSPCGQWVVRAYTGSVSLHGHEQLSGGYGISRFFRPRSRVQSGSHYSLPQLERARIDQFVELWSVEPLRLARRIKIGEATIDDVTKQKLTSESPFAAERLEAVAREFESATGDVAREPIATRYNELAAATRAWASGSEALNVLSQAADLRSFDETRPSDPPLESLLPADGPSSHWLRSLRGLQQQYFWAPDSTAFSVRMSNGMLHRADISGRHWSAEPWIIPKNPQPPEEAAAAVRTKLERELEVIVPLDGLDAVSCAAAIDRMRARLSDGISSLTHKGRLRFRFELSNQVVTEPEFFEHVRRFSDKAGPEPRAALARLWQSFNALPRSYAAPVGDAIYSEDAGGLAYAAAAFAEFDPMAFALLKRWFEFRWPEREVYGRTNVLPTIARVSAWASPEAVSFGLWAVVKDELYGPHFATHEIAQGVLRSARRQFTTQQMAVEVSVIMQLFADGDAVDHAKRCLRTLLYPHGPGGDLWDRQLARELDTASSP